ncbi:MAG: hypothetical protein ACK5KT_13215 [Dysgonomonas sp.]
MKKIFIIILATTLYSVNSPAQKSPHEDVAIAYDSLSNFLGKNAKGYTGQELYLKGLDKKSRNYGYNGFILDYKKDDDVLNDEKNIYKPNENYNSRYEDLAGRYFSVLEVIKHPKASTNATEYNNIFYLKLQELSNGDILYYKYNLGSEFTFPFIVRGFLEKQKELLSGKEYVVVDNVLKMSRNIVSGTALSFTTGETWRCIDVTMDNNTNELSLLLQNQRSIKTTIPYSEFNNTTDGTKKVYTSVEAAELTKKYNPNNFRRILQNKIREGMTKEMTLLAWGKPIEVKEEGKNERWIYSAGSLTFSGDKMRL